MNCTEELKHWKVGLSFFDSTFSLVHLARECSQTLSSSAAECGLQVFCTHWCKALVTKESRELLRNSKSSIICFFQQVMIVIAWKRKKFQTCSLLWQALHSCIVLVSLLLLCVVPSVVWLLIFVFTLEMIHCRQNTLEIQEKILSYCQILF